MRLLTIVAVLTSACRLDPLVPDEPGASASILPPGTVIPDAATNLDLVAQLSLHDGIDSSTSSKELVGNVIQRGTGQSNGATVRFWSFGIATRAPSPLYIFGTGDVAGKTFQPLPPGSPQLPLASAIPGDYTYSPLHTIYFVVVTPRYNGELITTTAALNDAVDLGLVERPVPTASFVDSPIVRPGLLLDVGPSGPLAPTKLFGHGHVVDTFRLGGDLGVQTATGLLPTSQVSYLREQGASPGYDASRPIFQATIPSQVMPSYTPLSAVVDVDLRAGADPTTIRSDSALFTRSTTGGIQGTTPDVAQFAVTTTLKVLQLQFMDGQP